MVAEAAAVGNTKALRMMLRAGISHSQHDSKGLTALLAAIVGKHLDAACMLIMHGMDRVTMHVRVVHCSCMTVYGAMQSVSS